MTAPVRRPRPRWLWGAFGRGSRRGLAYLLLGLPATALAWAAVLFVAIGGPLLGLTVVGVVILPVLLALLRATADLERARCALVLPTAPSRPYRDGGGPFRGARLRAQLTDPATWRDLVWLILAAPVNLACALVPLVTWAVGLSMVSVPIWYRFLPGGRAKLYEIGGVDHVVIGSVGAALPWAVAGAVLVWVGGWLSHGAALGQARLAAALLAPTRASGLQRRVDTLSANRAATIEGQRRELHRIERDLHDGAQARLVALSADLGLASEAFDEDPEQARRLVDEARDGVLTALTELRDLVRGIGPPVLFDRGLGAALDTAAAHSPIPVTATVRLPRRPPTRVEEAAYYVACECLANAAKHSGATLITIEIREHRDGCLVEVCDDGIGGADPRGGGLRGLADRVEALDGRLSVDSPPGGPTTVRAVLPCEW